MMALGHPAAPVAEPSPVAPAMNTLLLASACSGNREGLNILLNRKDAAGFQGLPFDLLAAYASGGGTVLSPESLLDGVTVGGDTALHAVAASGDSDDFLSCADLIYTKADLLFVQNSKGDTPLHLAARAGKSRMVSRLIGQAKGVIGNIGPAIATGAAREKKLLETENKLAETVLHEAVRVKSEDMVKLLMEEDPELARLPKDGTSPLYLAISLKSKTIAEILHEMSGGVLSYSGPKGQNALHVAALRGSGLTKMLLEWNKDLTTQRDENGSTPLHFATWPGGATCQRILEANSAAVYQPDHDGLFPIHVAAFVDTDSTISMFVKKCPSSAGLRDSKGRTFLHVAVQARNLKVVRMACRNQSISWILNMQDNDGNTPLHLAVQTGSVELFCALFMNLQVELNLTNGKGETPLNMTRYKITPGLSYMLNSEKYIFRALLAVGATVGVSRPDHSIQNYKDIHQLKSGDESKESNKIRESEESNKIRESEESNKLREGTQILSIGSVLIATVTFGATFALPGGYRADDHRNGGTPTLARRYGFDAFMMANTLSFVCSSMATVGFMYSGTSTVDLSIRKFYFNVSSYLMSTSISSLTAAFALGGYMVLAPVALNTAIAICVVSSTVVLSSELDFLLKGALLARPLCMRNGLVWTLRVYAKILVIKILLSFWPIIVSFGWAAYADARK